MTTDQEEERNHVHAMTTLPCGCKVWKPTGLPADNCPDHLPSPQVFIEPHNVPGALRLAEYGKAFAIRFKKRKPKAGEPEMRDMLARREKPKEGGKAAYDFSAKGLIAVWDLEKWGYRSIPMDSVTRFYINRTTYVVRSPMKDQNEDYGPELGGDL